MDKLEKIQKELRCTCKTEMGIDKNRNLLLHLSWCPYSFLWIEDYKKYISAPFYKRFFMNNPVNFTLSCRNINYK